MKFKELLEKYVADGRTKEWELMIKGAMPLSPSILKEFERFVPETYHVTSFKRVKEIYKLQGKKVDIPTFTIGSYGLSMGAIEETDVMFKLEGYSSFEAAQDFASILDRNGHRWVDSLNDKDLIVNNKFTVKINEAIVKEYGLKDRHSISNLITNMEGKEKSKFINFYYKEAKKLIDKKLIEELNKSIAKGYKGSFENNEIFLHNFKVKELLIVKNYEDDKYFKNSEAKAEKLGLKIDGIITREDISKINIKS